MTAIDWAAEAQRAYRISAEHGWHDEPRSWDRCVILAITELAEAYQAFRKEPAETMWQQVREELVDFAIRLLDTCVEHNVLLRSRWITSRLGEPPPTGPVDPVQALEDTISKAALWVTRSLRDYPRHTCMEAALSYVVRFFEDTGADLAGTLDLVQTRNENRPHRHGGRRA